MRSREPYVFSQFEELKIATVPLNEGTDEPLPDWAFKILSLKAIKRRGKEELILGHHRRILRYRTLQKINSNKE